eukprot:752850-Alexandrium_andersonii.AAC.1
MWIADDCSQTELIGHLTHSRIVLPGARSAVQQPRCKNWTTMRPRLISERAKGTTIGEAHLTSARSSATPGTSALAAVPLPA